VVPDWLDSFLLELLAFPHGRHDDQVDSVSHPELGSKRKVLRRTCGDRLADDQR